MKTTAAIGNKELEIIFSPPLMNLLCWTGGEDR
jgi:hypothetical protein